MFLFSYNLFQLSEDFVQSNETIHAVDFFHGLLSVIALTFLCLVSDHLKLEEIGLRLSHYPRCPRVMLLSSYR